jgi:fatty acid CoA ligase FadD9
LTGATGFLGRFLCLEWLERLAATGGTLICLIRAVDHDDAVRRLAATFQGIDPSLEKRFQALAGKHLEVVVGDVTRPRLGLSDPQFGLLAERVDRIVHSAALVNHILEYEHLFAPNVVGTAELIGLALAGRQKRFDFVSSLSTLYLARGTKIDEDSLLSDNIAITPEYGVGYRATKWAAEKLLYSAHRRFGLPVNIFRGDMMLAHRHYRGQINVPDNFTRLLCSVIVTGLAPTSFYRLAPDGARRPAHYDGLPVDFVAAAIAGISTDPHRDIRTFHVSNHHVDDGISLDTCVDWIQEAGYPVRRITDYQQWLRLFERSLQNLPESVRRNSSLALLDALRHPHDPNQPTAPNQRFQAAVRALHAEQEIPRLTESFIRRFLEDTRHLGLIPPPDYMRPRSQYRSLRA